MATQEPIYVPILKWKGGERTAVSKLDDGVKYRLLPIFLVMHDSEPDSFAAEVQRIWGMRTFYLGFHPTFAGNESTFVEELLVQDQCPNMIPVIHSITDSDYLSLIKDEAKLKENGIAIRISPGDFDEIESVLHALIGDLGIETQDIDLIIDTGPMDFPREVIKTLAAVVSSMIKKSEQFGFRRTIVSGSSFPETLRVPQRATSKLPRQEWELWKEVVQKYPTVIFGDYGSDDPKDPAFERGVTIIPTIRYTKDDFWYIVRGFYDPKAPYDYTQYHGLSRTLINLADVYSGEDFSWGDSKIFECAKKECLGPGTQCNHGNSATWVQISVNHHLTCVVHQVSSFPAFSGRP